METRLKSRKYAVYRKPKYYYTALRYMIEIFKAPKPKNIEYDYKLYKTQRKYVIETYYIGTSRQGNVRKNYKIPVKLSIPMISKDRGDLVISVDNSYWQFKKQIVGELLAYYGSLRK